MQLLLLLLLSNAPADQEPNKYPRGTLLVEAAELAQSSAGAAHRIIDVRPKAQFDTGHVPNAVWVNLSSWDNAFAESQDAEQWTKRIGDAGIDVDTKVVVYDDVNAKDAARAWWILRYFGIRDVRILNGGWKEWQRAGGHVSKDVAQVEQKSPKLAPEKARLAHKTDVIQAIENKQVQIIDARSKGEYCGTTTTAKRNGAIPGAVHSDWVELVDQTTGRFTSAAELTKIFTANGIDIQRPAMTYCQSGGRASVMAFVLELMDAKEVRNYYWSWSEWGNADDTPVLKPDRKP
jgi:thiosulfate/3-mercaptopyruvate sulfurtransferase